jgi:RND superfamily putative drug exporter
VKFIARIVVGRPLISLLVFLGLVGVSAIWGMQAFGNLQSAGYNDPNSESTQVYNELRTTFHVDNPEMVIIADFPESVNTDSTRVQADALTKTITDVPGVSSVSSYFSLGEPASLKSTDSKAAYFFVNYDSTVKVSSETTVLESALGAEHDGAKIYYTGLSAMANALNGTITKDIGLAESIAIPLSLILLLFVFGSLVAAGLPLMIGGLGMLGGFFFIWVATQVTDVSIFALNLVTAMGLGLGIDYALLMVNRVREERTRGLDVTAAVTRTLETAGRTVLFSGLTVAVVIASMVIFPQYFLRSFAYAGVAVVFVAVLGALIALPATLTLLGDRVNKLRVIRGSLAPKDTGMWASVSRFVMRRAIPVLIIALIALGGLVSLGANVKFGLVDERILAKDAPIAVASEIQRTRFDGQEGKPVEIIVTGASEKQLAEYVDALSSTEHIVRVQSQLGITVDGKTDARFASGFAGYVSGSQQRVVAIDNVEARSTAGMDLIDSIRELNTPFKVQVGGIAADYTDSMNGITNKLPLLLLWVLISTLVLLFLFTGSILLPLKAFLLNVVTLAATLGFLCWVFLDGNLKWLVGDFQLTGSIDASNFILIAVVAFGLSMDYELFLLSRIKELHDQGLSTEESVALGLQRSGRIITAAALILAVNFLPFVTSGVTSIKMLGLGLAFAILLDATIVRAFLVPALMKLFGAANWWAPKWMKWVYAKAGLDH